ncbi:alpha/beta fold hydrolase [Altericroceibacterium endophyticum]|uniref:Alpha/beta fold hydrolase n=1 Tax=Altericroceibacterium endophyticum TaxID=1808508 RepID=A0A6I4T4E8_9SPHN|nr:alpha/beta hydrolase [Altericroceibacterium endophyticum]MXO65249.1 alpha/beta fold hydrolase [Altericroceibacterium endophyticum]
MVVFLPGLICDATMFTPQVAFFSDSRAIDGYKNADSMEEMARIVLDSAPERFDLFGHSMGGRVALEVFRQAPERVRRFAISSTGVHPRKEGETEKRHALRQVGYDHGFEALVDQWLPPMIAEQNRAKPEIVHPLKEMCMAAGQDTFDAHVRALLGRPEVESLLPQIMCPTLVMTGELDQWSPPAQLEAIADQMPNAELVVVPGAGHMITREAPEAVNAAISDWLARPAD